MKSRFIATLAMAAAAGAIGLAPVAAAAPTGTVTPTQVERRSSRGRAMHR